MSLFVTRGGAGRVCGCLTAAGAPGRGPGSPRTSHGTLWSAPQPLPFQKILELVRLLEALVPTYSTGWQGSGWPSRHAQHPLAWAATSLAPKAPKEHALLTLSLWLVIFIFLKICHHRCQERRVQINLFSL